MADSGMLAVRDLKCHLPETALPSNLTSHLTERVVESCGGDSLTNSPSESLSQRTKTAEKEKNKSEAPSFWVQCRTECSAEDKATCVNRELAAFPDMLSQCCPGFVSILGELMGEITFTEAIWGCETRVESCSCESGGECMRSAICARDETGSVRQEEARLCWACIVRTPTRMSRRCRETDAEVISIKISPVCSGSPAVQRQARSYRHSALLCCQWSPAPQGVFTVLSNQDSFSSTGSEHTFLRHVTQQPQPLTRQTPLHLKLLCRSG